MRRLFVEKLCMHYESSNELYWTWWSIFTLGASINPAIKQINVIKLGANIEIKWRYQYTDSEELIRVQCGKTVTTGSTNSGNQIQVIAIVNKDQNASIRPQTFAKVAGKVKGLDVLVFFIVHWLLFYCSLCRSASVGILGKVREFWYGFFELFWNGDQPKSNGN